MDNNQYRPEGLLISSASNREYISGIAGLEKAMAQGKILESVVLMCDGDFNLHVDLGEVHGIILHGEVAYNADGSRVKDISAITRVGKAVCFKIQSVGRGEDGRPVAYLSRREAQKECLENYLCSLRPGDVIDAKITHLEHFGAFVDVGCGIASLLSIDCISVSRISHPKDRFFEGMFIKTVVKSTDCSIGRIYVSHKELLGTWEENAALFEVGQTVAGIVRSIEEYGIFVELMPNLAGLAEYRDDVCIGQTAAVYIKNIIPERMKFKLVLIDSYKGEAARPPLRYFFGEDHMDRFIYSPAISQKQIQTVFC